MNAPAEAPEVQEFILLLQEKCDLVAAIKHGESAIELISEPHPRMVFESLLAISKLRLEKVLTELAVANGEEIVANMESGYRKRLVERMASY